MYQKNTVEINSISSSAVREDILDGKLFAIESVSGKVGFAAKDTYIEIVVLRMKKNCCQ